MKSIPSKSFQSRGANSYVSLMPGPVPMDAPNVLRQSIRLVFSGPFRSHAYLQAIRGFLQMLSGLSMLFARLVLFALFPLGILVVCFLLAYARRAGGPSRVGLGSGYALRKSASPARPVLVERPISANSLNGSLN